MKRSYCKKCSNVTKTPEGWYCDYFEMLCRDVTNCISRDSEWSDKKESEKLNREYKW